MRHASAKCVGNLVLRTFADFSGGRIASVSDTVIAGRYLLEVYEPTVEMGLLHDELNALSRSFCSVMNN